MKAIKQATLTTPLTPARLRRTDDSGDYVVLERKESGDSETKGLVLQSGLGGLRGAGSRAVGKMSLPTPLVLFPARRMRMQFVATASNTRNVTVGELLAAFGNIGTVTNSAMVAMHTSVRIRSIKIWPSCSASSTGQADIIWTGAGANVPDNEKVRNVPVGVLVTGACVFTPPPKSLNSFWWSVPDSATQLFQGVVTTGGIIEVDCDLMQAQAFAPLTTTVATAVVGTIYYGYLDGATTHTWQPLGVVSTF